MENPYWHPEEKRHVVNGDDVRDLAFDIFNIIRASAALKAESALRQAEDEEVEPNSIEQVHYDRAEYHFSSKLLRIAVLMRTLDDYWSDWGHEDYLEELKKINEEAGVGTLEINERSGDLTLRDAFNKIIHATDVRPVYEKDDDSEGDAVCWGMDGQLELTGKHHGNEWKATIFVESFLDAVIDLLEVTEELES